MSKIITKFYVDLDSLLDTRFGTLMRMEPKYAIYASGADEYSNRVTDDFRAIFGDEFDLQFYKELYQHRDKSTLFYSRRTDMVTFLRQQIYRQAILKATGDPRIGQLEVVVNYYPYKLDEEDINVYRELLSITLETESRFIKLEYRPYTEMTLHWLRETEPAVMVLYNFTEWINICPDFPKSEEEYQGVYASPETMLFAPGLLTDKDSLKTFNELDKSELTDKDPFTILARGLSPFFAYQALPPRLFSAVRLINEETVMNNVTELVNDINVMNKIAGRQQNNELTDIVMQTNLITEEFVETVSGLIDGLEKGDWDEFRNGLGDMSVVIWGMQAVTTIPMVEDLAVIMEKNMTKFDTDFVTASKSLNRMNELGYKCEIKEVEVDGKTYYPIITTDDGVVVNEMGVKKPYTKGKFLKSVNWSVEELQPNLDLPTKDIVTDNHVELVDKMISNAIMKLTEAQSKLRRSFMKSS